MHTMNHSPLDQTLRRVWGETAVMMRRNATDRLQAKQDEFVNVIAPYYGNATADKIAVVLKRFMTTRAHADAVDAASLLKDPSIADMLDRLAAATTTETAFDAAMNIADAIANRIARF